MCPKVQLTIILFKLTRSQCQIINLGAGHDTLYWKMKEDSLNFISYVEVDFPAITTRKCQVIKTSQNLRNSMEAGRLIEYLTAAYSLHYKIYAFI